MPSRMHFAKGRDETVRLGAFKGRFGENITGRYIDHLVETFPAPVQHYDQVPCTVLYCNVLYCTVMYCTVMYCTVLYCTVLYCTVLYYNILY